MINYLEKVFKHITFKCLISVDTLGFPTYTPGRGG